MLQIRIGTFLKGAAAAVLLAIAPPAWADSVNINVGWETPADSKLGILAVKFKELVEQYTDGAVTVSLRCCGQIGSEETAFSAMQLGTVDAFLISSNNVSPNYPLMNVFVLPYIFQNQEHIAQVLEGEVGRELARRLYDDTGVHLIAYGGVFFREVFTIERPVHSIDDMAGLKFRVPQNRVMIETADAFGTQPVALAWSEVPTALQTGAIDASDNGLATIRDMKFYEFAKHLVRLDHIAAFVPLFMSDRVMKKLDDAQQEAVRRAAAEASSYQSAIIFAEEEATRQWLKNQGGMALYSPDTAPFIEAAMAVQDRFAAEAGTDFQELVEKIRTAAE